MHSMAFARHRWQPFSSPEHLNYKGKGEPLASFRYLPRRNTSTWPCATPIAGLLSLKVVMVMNEHVFARTFFTRQCTHAFCASGPRRFSLIRFLTLKVSSPVVESLYFKVLNMVQPGISHNMYSADKNLVASGSGRSIVCVQRLE